MEWECTGLETGPELCHGRSRLRLLGGLPCLAFASAPRRAPLASPTRPPPPGALFLSPVPFRPSAFVSADDVNAAVNVERGRGKARASLACEVK